MVLDNRPAMCRICRNAEINDDLRVTSKEFLLYLMPLKITTNTTQESELRKKGIALKQAIAQAEA